MKKLWFIYYNLEDYSYKQRLLILKESALNYTVLNKRKLLPFSKLGLYKIIKINDGILVYGFDEDILQYLISKYKRDVLHDEIYKNETNRFENRYSHLFCDDISKFFTSE